MNITEVAQVADPEVRDARQAAGLIDRMRITTNAELQTATQWIAEVKNKAEEVDAKRRSFVDPLNHTISEINAFFKPALDSLRAAEAALKGKIQTHVTSNLEKRDLLLNAVGQTPDAKERTALVAAATELVPEKVDGLSIRESWTGEVVDRDALLAWAINYARFELLQVDEKALVAITKAAARDPQIPGWKAVVKRTVAVTASRVLK